jgi:PAS domain S-box-containing protein
MPPSIQPPAGAGQSDTPPQPAYRELSRTFWRGVATTHGLGAAIQGVLQEFNSHVGSRRTSVWLHDRRARELWLVASSDPSLAAAGTRVSANDADQAAARGLRLGKPEVLAHEPEPVLIAPLRGWRRALGTLVVEGSISDEVGDRQRLDLAGDLGRHLSAGIENVQLFEDMLRQRRLLEDTFNSLLDLVLVTDGSRRVVQMNDACAVRLGRPRAELLERPLAELVGSELADWMAADDPEHGTERVRTLEHEGLGGTFVVTLTPLIDEDGEPVGHVLVARDVTRQTRLEAEREALRAKLAQAEKLASLGQFVAGIAHEINNPLQGVLGHLELLMTAPAPPDAPSGDHRALRRELRRIYREADRAAKIVQKLLTFSGAHRVIRRRLRIERVLQRAIASRRRALEREQITVRRDEKDANATVVGDPMLLQQAFLNVIINAEHAIAATGQPGTIEISTICRDQRVITRIRDTGPGIAADVLPRVFDPFFTTKVVGQGTGLGLAITYGIIQDHGGTIHGGNDRGAVFTIDLPTAPP